MDKEKFIGDGYREEYDVSSPKNINKVREAVEYLDKNMSKEDNKPEIQFNPTTHTYTRNGTEYISATTIIDRYKKPFNRRFWAMYSALKEGLNYRVYAQEDFNTIQINNRPYSIDELYSIEVYKEAARYTKNGWDETTKTACDRGNKIHNFLEDSINESKVGGSKTNSILSPSTGEGLSIFKTKHDLDCTNLEEVYPEIYNTLLFYISKGCTIYAEKKVYIDKYQVSGTIDCLVVKGNQFVIIDWKTNKDIIHFRSGYYKKMKIGSKYVKTNEWKLKEKYLLEPIDSLEECKGVLYTLQLSLYAYIFESWGYKLLKDGLMIYHMRPEERPKRIPIVYMKNEIHSILEHYKQIA